MGHRLFNERSFNIWQICPKSVNREVPPPGGIARLPSRAVSAVGLVNKMDEKQAQLERVPFRLR